MLLFRRIKNNWEVYFLQFITLSIAFAASILVISFCVKEFSVNSQFDKNVVRVLKRNDNNRLTDRVPKEILDHENLTVAARVKVLNGVYAVDSVFKGYFDNSIYYNDDTIRALGYDPNEFSVYGIASGPIEGYELQPVSDIYFGPRVIGESQRHGDPYCMLILVCISSLITLLALTNFVNLTSLTLPARSKELAVRKVAGAQKPSLLLMLGIESFGISFIALLAGAVLVSTTDLFIIHHSLGGYLALAILFLLIAIAPLFPALAFVKATPGRLFGPDPITFPEMKKLITVIQLGVSISLIVASLVIDRQISRSLIKEPGKNHDQVIYMPYPSDLTRDGLNRMKVDWPRNNPNIVELTAVSHTPDNLTSKPIGEDYYRLNVDYDFKDFFDLELASGRWFSVNDNDSTIVNEACHCSDPTAIGVLKNFAGIYNLPDKPVRITIDKDEYNFLMIRVLEVNIRSTLKVIAEVGKELNRGRLVTISFLDKNYEQTLAYEDRLNKLSSLLAVVSIVMATCAIYALSLSRMKDNLKQIAVRKTFGASDRQIVQRLSLQFLELMLVSLFFFGPLAYWLLHEWLRNFAYAAKFAWSDPVISIGICLAIVATTNLLLLARINTTSLSRIHRA
jgi:ABC-type antimicrobial peptide transport system permease subunit